MRQLFGDVDLLLRGEFTRREDLTEGRITAPARTLAIAALVLGAAYGAFMGIYGVLRPGNATWQQLVASMLKVPLLFLLTLVVTVPSLYVFAALARSRLKFRETLRLLLAAIAVNLALLASLGPVLGFFTLSTTSYSFLVTLNVVFFGVAGLAGLIFLKRALDQVFAAARDAALTGEPGRVVFRTWLLVYGVVGAQMGWILRPFVGTPDLPFTWFRPRESNFFAAVLGALRDLFEK